MTTTTSNPIADAILRGDYDDQLNFIQHACSLRLKRMFRKGAMVEITSGKLEGLTGVVLKVNPKRVAVGLGDHSTEHGADYYSAGSWNVPPSMLRVLGTEVPR